MKPIEKINSLLQEDISGKEFELLHQFKLLKLDMYKLEQELMLVHNDKLIMEHHLNSTIKDLAESNKKIRQLRRKELKEKERLLRFEQNRLEQITHAMTSSIAYVDNNFIYRYTNHMYTEWFGERASDIIGKSVSEVIGEDFFKMTKPLYDRVFQGENYSYENQTIYNGKPLYLRVNYVPATDEAGNNIGLYIFAHNITENKLIEEEIRTSKKELSQTNKKLTKYIESNIQLEQFAHIAAHDMKSPLRSISSFAGLLKMNLDNTLEPKNRNYFNIIEEGTKTLNALITDLLDYSKLGAKKLELSQVDLGRLLQKILTYLKSSIDEKKAVIKIGELPTVITADRTKLYQVFQNLISNALKFTPHNAMAEIEIYSEECPDHFHFYVKDNGIGISPEHQSVIFDSFKQLHSKTEYQGTGLGLSICKKIITDHGGEIKVTSEPGQGSTFHFAISKGLTDSK